MTAIRKYWIALIFSALSIPAFAQHDDHQHPQEATEHQEPAADTHPTAHPTGEAHSECGHSIDAEVEGEYNAGDVAVHHIADANAIHIFG